MRIQNDNASDFEVITPSDPQNHPIIVRFDSIAKLSDGTLQMQCAGYPLQTYRLLATPNLSDPFTPAATNSATDGTLQFSDATTNSSSRFYKFGP